MLYYILTYSTGEPPKNDVTLYNYFWNGEKKVWTPWLKVVPKYEYDPAVSAVYQ